jgi:hypothetical protein
MIADIYDPQVWGGFFQLVGTGAAALTGLVFVSMSLNLHAIVQDDTHRYRAICNLSGLTAIFTICAFAVMGGQNHAAVGAEALIISIVALSIYVYGYTRAFVGAGSRVGLSLRRFVTGVSCYLIMIAGAVVLISGHITGMFVLAAAMTLNILFFISGAWLLMVGVQQPVNRPSDPGGSTP